MTTIGIAGVNQYPSTCEGGIPQNGDTRIGDGWGAWHGVARGVVSER